MKIKTSKYNEISFEEAKKHVKCIGQIVKPTAVINGVRREIYPQGVYLGTMKFGNGKKIEIFSDYEVSIANVKLPFAAGEDAYFDSEIEINL